MKLFLFFLSGFAFGFGISSLIYYFKDQSNMIYIYKRGYKDALIKRKN